MVALRLAGLAVLAGLALLTFATGPDDGLFARPATLALIGVIALIWHLAFARPAHAAAGPSTPTVPTVSSVPTADDGAAAALDRDLTSDPSIVIDLTESSGRAPGRSAPPVHAGPTRVGYFDSEPDPDGPTGAAATSVETVPASFQEDLSSLPDPPVAWEPDSIVVPNAFVLDGDDLSDLATGAAVIPSPVTRTDAAPAAEPVQDGPTERPQRGDAWLLWAEDLFRDPPDAGDARRGQ